MPRSIPRILLRELGSGLDVVDACNDLRGFVPRGLSTNTRLSNATYTTIVAQ